MSTNTLGISLVLDPNCAMLRVTATLVRLAGHCTTTTGFVLFRYGRVRLPLSVVMFTVGAPSQADLVVLATDEVLAADDDDDDVIVLFVAVDVANEVMVEDAADAVTVEDESPKLDALSVAADVASCAATSGRASSSSNNAATSSPRCMRKGVLDAMRLLCGRKGSSRGSSEAIGGADLGPSHGQC